MVKCPPAMRETRVRSLGLEDPLEKKMAIHSSTLAWKISWMESLGRLQSIAITINKRVQNAVFGYNLKKDRRISVLFQGKPFNITVIPVYALTDNAEAEVEWFYEDLQDLLELTCRKDVLFIIGEWNVKAGSQEIPKVTGKFGLGVQNEAGQRLTSFAKRRHRS